MVVTGIVAVLLYSNFVIQVCYSGVIRGVIGGLRFDSLVETCCPL